MLVQTAVVTRGPIKRNASVSGFERRQIDAVSVASHMFVYAEPGDLDASEHKNTSVFKLPARITSRQRTITTKTISITTYNALQASLIIAP